MLIKEIVQPRWNFKVYQKERAALPRWAIFWSICFGTSDLLHLFYLQVSEYPRVGDIEVQQSNQERKCVMKRIVMRFQDHTDMVGNAYIVPFYQTDMLLVLSCDHILECDLGPSRQPDALYIYSYKLNPVTFVSITYKIILPVSFNKLPGGGGTVDNHMCILH